MYGSKPNEIRHPEAVLLVEQYPVQRVQSLGYSADLNSEEVFQLTDENVVEIVDSDPNVSVTIDVNEFGSINLYNQFAGNYNYPLHAAGLFSSGGTNHNTNANDGVIAHTELSQTAIDMMVKIRESSSDTTTTRSLWFNNCFIESISGTYQVDGFATESISLAGSSQVWFLHEWGRLRPGIGIVGNGSDQGQTLGHIDVTHSNLLGEAVVVTEDGIRLSDSYWQLDVNGDIAPKPDYSFSTTKRYRYLYKPNDSQYVTESLPEPVGSSAIGGVKEGEIEIFLWDANSAAEPAIGTADTSQLLRVQSVDYELSFDREDLKQITTGTYYKGVNETNVTATINVLDSDLELFALAAGKKSEYETYDVTELSLSDFQTSTALGMRIDIFNSNDQLLHNAGTHLKSIGFTGGKVTNVSDSRDVPGRGSQTFELSFTTMDWTGTGLDGR